uniref:DDE Tnp4 domain-containing protein n=1 Tax=Neogobius melanostomus TaxID=47308 RepID=A0A8C6SNW2_9GOBI
MVLYTITDRVFDRRKALALFLLLRLRRRQNLRLWIHPINQNRRQFGAYHHLVAELQLHPDKHFTYFRMSALQMEGLLSIIGPTIRREDTNYRKSMSPKQRLAVTIRFLATGESFTSLAFQYRLGVSTVATIVHNTLEALESHMLGTQIPVPTEDIWSTVAAGFWEKWNYPNCIGAIDGKHIEIRAPPNSGSLFYDYKHHFSINLLAVVDADSRFIYIHVGDYGGASDGGIFSTSPLKRGLEQNRLHVPAPSLLPNDGPEGLMPHVIVGDAAFPLKPYLMRPYSGMNLRGPKQTFNYRLSRARMAVECAFGIMAGRWRVLLTKINMTPEHVDTTVVVCCILHNYLSNPSDNRRWLEESNQGQMCMRRSVGEMGGHRPSQEAASVRQRFTDYFQSAAGDLPHAD